MSGSVGGGGAFGGAGTRDFTVRLRAAVAEKLPDVADLLDFVEIEISDQEFVFVAAALRDDLAARIAKVALAVKLADLPRRLGANAIDGSDEVLVGHGMGGLLEFPEIFRKASDGSGGVVHNFGAVEPETPRAFGQPPAPPHTDPTPPPPPLHHATL